MNRFLTLLAYVFLLLLANVSCTETEPISTPVEQGLSFRNEERLVSHWQKHGHEFEPGLTKEDYLSRARAFFNDNTPEKELKYRPNGDVLHYKGSTNEFGVLTDEPVIKTYFRPNTGRQYWERQ